MDLKIVSSIVLGVVAIGGCSTAGGYFTKQEPAVVKLSEQQYGVQFAAKDPADANNKLEKIGRENCASDQYEVSDYNTEEVIIYQKIVATVNCK